jgi:outer membrane protein assembly factor BamB
MANTPRLRLLALAAAAGCVHPRDRPAETLVDANIAPSAPALDADLPVDRPSGASADASLSPPTDAPPRTGSTHALAISLMGAGQGTIDSDPPGIHCPGTCMAPFAPGATVDLTATPAASNAFLGWAGPCQGASLCRLRLDVDRQATGRFERAEGLVWQRPVPYLSALAQAAGTVFAAGRIEAPLTLAGKSLSSAGGRDAFLAAFTTDGAVSWVVTYGAAGNDEHQSIAVERSGDLLVTGCATTPDTGGRAQAFLARYTAAGARSWVKPIGECLDPPAAAAVAGGFLSFTSAPDGITFTRWDGDGRPQLPKVVVRARPEDTAVVKGFQMDQQGSIYALLELQASLNYRHQLIRLAPDGTVVWQLETVETEGLFDPEQVVIDGDGDLLALVSLGSGVSFGTTSFRSSPGMSLLLTRHAATTGDVRWGKLLPGQPALARVAVGTGPVLVGGSLPAPADLGGGTLAGPGYLLQLDGASGAHRWSRSVPIDVFGVIAGPGLVVAQLFPLSLAAFSP